MLIMSLNNPSWLCSYASVRSREESVIYCSSLTILFHRKSLGPRFVISVSLKARTVKVEQIPFGCITQFTAVYCKCTGVISPQMCNSDRSTVWQLLSRELKMRALQLFHLTRRFPQKFLHLESLQTGKCSLRHNDKFMKKIKKSHSTKTAN